jgi:hypothetical protein
MGSQTNTSIGSFQTDALGPIRVSAQVEDAMTNKTVDVRTFAPLTVPLSAEPVWQANGTNRRTSVMRVSGIDSQEAFARAQGATAAAATAAVTVDGEVDSATYGNLLQARGLVGLRGVGLAHDGLWYVQQVTHQIKHGSYTQAFTLSRDGHGSTLPFVTP